jgi:hypothetical protein
VTIKDDGGVDPVITPADGEIVINGLTIESGSLTVLPGSEFTINGNLETTGDTAVLVIENTVNDPSSLILNGAATDTVTVKWTYPSGNYWYIGHPVQGMKYSDFDNAAGGNFKLFKYTGSAWQQITAADNYDFDANPVEGYAFKNLTCSDVTVAFTGILHNTGYSSPINGWNLIANPYTSYIDVENAGFDYGNSLSTIWTTTNRSGSTQYATYNIDSDLGQLDGTRYIAPGQSIWLRNYAAGTFNISTSTRVHAPASLTQEQLQLKGAMVYEPDDVLRLTLDNGTAHDEVVMAFRTYGTLDELTNYDSEKRLGSKTIPNIYTMKGGKRAVISVYPETMENDTVQMGYMFGSATEITLKATNIDNFAAFQDVYLFDKKTGVEINLRETPVYKFTAVAGEESDRFELYFDHVATGVGRIDGAGTSGMVRIYGYRNKGFVEVSEDILVEAGNKGLIRVYNASGSLLKEVKLIDTKTTIDLPDNHGLYIIEVRTGDKVLTGKISGVR